nr:MAG: putative capsid protein [Arizlama virus]
MAYKRKFSRGRKRSFRSSRGKGTTMARKRLVRTIKAVTRKTCEPKEKTFEYAKTEVYHNSPNSILVNNPTVMPAQGVGDNQRVGDQINCTGYKFRVLFGQKADRPNVTWRWWFIKVPKGSPYTYTTWFNAITNNVLLDDMNADFVKVLKSGQMRPNEAGLSNAGGDEYTFVKKFWFSYRHLLKFGPNNAAVTHNDDDLYFMFAAYDAYGSLLTDNIAYIQAGISLYYRDP